MKLDADLLRDFIMTVAEADPPLEMDLAFIRNRFGADNMDKMFQVVPFARDLHLVEAEDVAGGFHVWRLTAEGNDFYSLALRPAAWSEASRKITKALGTVNYHLLLETLRSIARNEIESSS